MKNTANCFFNADLGSLKQNLTVFVSFNVCKHELLVFLAMSKLFASPGSKFKLEFFTL